MKPLPVILGIARYAGNLETKRPSTKNAVVAMPEPLTAESKKAVFDRDNYVCRCCGFRAEKYQEIHFLDHDKTNVAVDNMATLCIFCHQCFNLDLTCSMRSGVLIWLPEISQTDLHHIMRAVYVARISQGPMAEAARVVLDTIMARRDESRHRIGTDDPFVLTSVMRDFLTSRYYSERAEKLEGIRLMPLDRRLIREAELEFNQFPQILAYWRSKQGPFGDRTPTLWLKFYKDAFGLNEDASTAA